MLQMLGAKILESDLKLYMAHIQSLPKQNDPARKGSSSSLDDEKNNSGTGNSATNSNSRSGQKTVKSERGGLPSILV